MMIFSVYAVGTQISPLIFFSIVGLLIIAAVFLFWKLKQATSALKEKERLIKSKDKELVHQCDVIEMLFNGILKYENRLSLQPALVKFSQKNGFSFAAILVRSAADAVVQICSEESCLNPLKTFHRLSDLMTGQIKSFKQASLISLEDIQDCLVGDDIPAGSHVIFLPLVRDDACQAIFLAFTDKANGEELFPEVQELWLAVTLGFLSQELWDQNLHLQRFKGELLEFLKDAISKPESENIRSKTEQILGELAIDAQVSIFESDPSHGFQLKSGRVIADKTVFAMIAKAVDAWEKKRRNFTYVPRSESFKNDYSVESVTDPVQSMLLVPMTAHSNLTGMVVLECSEQESIDSNMLDAIVHIVKMSSILLKSVSNFEKSLQHYQNQTSSSELALKNIQRQYELKEGALRNMELQIREQELAMKELENLNSIFSLVQVSKVSVTNLKGFLKMMQESLGKLSIKMEEFDWFRNFMVELERLDLTLQKFELIRVITEREYKFKKEEADPVVFFGSLFDSIRSRLMAKKILVEVTYDPGLRPMEIDSYLTSLSIRQFVIRLQEMFAGGNMPVNVIQKKNQTECKIHIDINEEESLKLYKKIEEDLRKEFVYILLNRVLQKQKGELSCLLDEQTTVVITMRFPSR